MHSSERFMPQSTEKFDQAVVDVARRSEGIYSALDGFWQYLEEMGFPYQAKKAKDACDLFKIVDDKFQLAANRAHLKLDGVKNV